ncbi:MAG: hypothetical protein AAFY91_04350, partial [Bacteroidota bacterium]
FFSGNSIYGNTSLIQREGGDQKATQSDKPKASETREVEVKVKKDKATGKAKASVSTTRTSEQKLNKAASVKVKEKTTDETKETSASIKAKAKNKKVEVSAESGVKATQSFDPTKADKVSVFAVGTVVGTIYQDDSSKLKLMFQGAYDTKKGGDVSGTIIYEFNSDSKTRFFIKGQGGYSQDGGAYGTGGVGLSF